MRDRVMSIEAQQWIKVILISSMLFVLFYGANAFAGMPGDLGGGGAGGSGSGDIGGVAHQVQQSLSNVAKLITGGAYVAGFAFVLGAIFKFKAHKDNPNQNPVGTPIALLFIGASMIFLPQIMSVMGVTMFTDTGEVGGVGGADTFGDFNTPGGSN